MKMKQSLFLSKKSKHFNGFQNKPFCVLWLKWTQTMKMKQNQIFFRGTCSDLTSNFFVPKTWKYFSEFQNQNFSLLWLKGAHAMEMKQNQIFLPETNSDFI